MRADSKSIGREGFEWLLISIASTWGGDVGRKDKAKSDKIPLQDRIEWVLSNEDMFLAFAEEPKKNQGWMSADKPWQHIAACFELLRFRRWQCRLYEEVGIEAFDRYDFESHTEVYIDGLAAVVKFREFGEHPSGTIPSQLHAVYACIGVTTIPKGSTLK